MPQVSSVFLLKTYNAVGGLVTNFTRGYKFIGGAVVTVDSQNIVTVDLTGASGNAWDVMGNAGPGLVLGTTSPDDWNFIAGGLERGGFFFTGEFFLKTHTGFSESEFKIKTGAVETTDATLTTIFAIPITDLTNNLITARIVAREDTGVDRGAWERKVMYYRQGTSAISTKVHTTFTDKTQDGYNVSFQISGNNLLVQVKGLNAQTIYWTGAVEYQGVKQNP